MIRVWIFQDRDEIFEPKEPDPVCLLSEPPECLYKDFNVMEEALIFMRSMIEAGFAVAADNH